MSSKPESITAAGFVIFKYTENKNLVFLALKALPEFQKKNHGLYDIPKGGIDRGETALQCAIRESNEEAGINVSRLHAGPYVNDRLTVWLAESYQIPTIGINPITGIQEHIGYEWVKPCIMEAQCLDYLKPHIRWAKKHMEDL
jgi:hypothetical protein